MLSALASRGLLAAALAIGAGCGGALHSERDPRFVGTWKLTTDSISVRSETWEFRSDGSITMLDRDFETTPILITRRDTVGCAFGEHWSSREPTLIVVSLQCSDAVARTGNVAFSRDVATDSEGAEIKIVSVDGERDWEPQGGGRSLTLHRVR